MDLGRGIFFIALLGVCALPVNAQRPSAIPSQNPSAGQVSEPLQETDGQSSLTIKVNSQLVQLDVVVRNAKGELVRGLSSNDFSVFEDDVPQKVVAFEATSPVQTGGSATRIDSTAELDGREPEAPVTILVLDELATTFEDEFFARYSVEKYMSKQGEVLDQPMMLIARTVDRTMELCDYTTSKKKILQALDRHLAGNDWRNQNPNYRDVQMGAAFASLIEIAKATEGHAGHKNLIWIGRGFPSLRWADMQRAQADVLQQAVSQCVDLLRQARITLYVIDPAGVSVNAGAQDENGFITPDDPFGGAIDFDSIASATGGQSMHGRNDVDHLIDKAVANGEAFYTLAYRPSSPADADPKQFRRIKVVPKDSSLTVISRQGYFPGLSPAPVALTDANGKLTEGSQFDLASAISGLMVFDGVPLTVTRPNPPSNDIQISFPVSAIGLSLSDDKLIGDVTLITLSYDRFGKIVARNGRVVSLHLAPMPPGQVENRTVQLATVLPQIPAARMRFVVRANTNGKIGTDNLFLVDPGTLKDPVTGLKTQR